MISNTKHDQNTMNLRSYPNALQRRNALGKSLGVELDSLGAVLVDEESMLNCENVIGAVSIPVGVAGPLQIANQSKNYFVPLATTEGALVASVSRGCKAISSSGGAQALVYNLGTTRGPVFETGSIAKSNELRAYLKSNEEKLKEIAAKTSSHLQLTKIQIKGTGRYVYVRFSYNTGDAMGMNMVTIATQAIVNEIEAATGATCPAVAGNFDTDKKPAWQHIGLGRGKEAWAEVILPANILNNVLKTTAEAMFNTWISKCMIGSYVSGSLGFNCHFANVVAAYFIATGQDPAHVVEGSHGITVLKVLANKDLYVSVFAPSLMYGLVGGGTKLKTQTANRALIGATSVEEFGEVLISAILAGEISLLASLSVSGLAQSHLALGR